MPAAQDLSSCWYSEGLLVSQIGDLGGREVFPRPAGSPVPQGTGPGDMAAQGGDRAGGAGGWQGSSQGPSGDLLGPQDEPAGPLELPSQSPLFHAQQAARYDRQLLIKAYQLEFNCRLVVMNDAVFPDGVVLFEELIYNSDPDLDLHLLLDSPGGDGETAVRLVRSAQERCRRLVVVVPGQAKSAATLLAMGAHEILMGPTSDLGPVDPQFRLGDGLVSAKDLIEAVDRAMDQVATQPETYPLHASLLADINAVMIQQARSALARTGDLVDEALASNPDRDEETVRELRESLRDPLIDKPRSHAAVFGAQVAMDAGLPVQRLDPRSRQWQLVWRLWMKYLILEPSSVYEGEHSSQIIPHLRSS